MVPIADPGASSKAICSLCWNVPVTPSSVILEALPFVLEYPVAPDVIPTYFLPDTILTAPVKIMFVYRSTSAKAS